MLDILLNWNRWGSNQLNSGIPRQLTKTICKFIDMPEIIALIGLRRVGKSTILYQIMDYLESQNIPQQAMLYVNFEDPGFVNHLSPNLLDEVYKTYREEVNPTGTAYLFFDEIQAVPQWERWVSTRNETENIKVFVTGSSAELMSRELATLLTGRHVAFEAHGLNFSEFLQFKKIELPKKPWPKNPTPIIAAALKEYLEWGGLPRVVIEQENLVKRALLSNYLDDILFKDIALRHSIRNMNVLRNLAVYLITQTSSKISYKRLANIFEASPDLVQNYCGYLEESYLISFLKYYSLKAAEQNRNPQKTHVSDLGYRTIANMSALPDYGKLSETLVYNHVRPNEDDGIFYWDQSTEVDILIRRGVNVSTLIQVVYEGLDKKKTFDREIKSLTQSHKVYPKAQKIIVTAKYPPVLEEYPKYIEIIPLWQFLLSGVS